MGLAMEVVLSLGSGYLLSIIFWPRRQSSAFEVLYCIFLALGLAVGLSSIVLVFARAFSVDHLIALDISIFALLAASYIIIRPRKSIRTLQSEIIGQNEQNWLDRVLVSSFVIVTAAALYSTVLRCIAHPHGEGWDAFSIWNLHARFLFRGGTAWRDGFTSIIPWSHPDYPLLLPGAITHLLDLPRAGEPGCACDHGVRIHFRHSGIAVLLSRHNSRKSRCSPCNYGAAVDAVFR